LESPHIYDELMLLIMKFNIGELNFDLIPKKIYFYLIAFINETVRGIDSSVELSKFNILLSFFIRLRKHDMSESLQFFKENNLASNMFCFSPNINEDLDFLHLKPKKEEIRIHFSFDSSNLTGWFQNRAKEHSIAILISILEPFVDEIPNSQLETLNSDIICSNGFIDKLVIMPNSQEGIERRINDSSKFYIRAQLCSAYKKAFNIDLPQCYLCSRNVLNVLDMDKFQEVYAPYQVWDSQLETVYLSNSMSLSKLEEITIILRSGLVPQPGIYKVMNHPNLNSFDFPSLKTFGELISL
jgi:hypothetical protein